MKLHFRNNYSSSVYVAIMFYNPDSCRDYGNWGTRGWWNINPGGEVYVIDTSNRYAAYYIEAVDGAIWNGSYGPVYVKQASFNSCINIGDTSSRTVGMRLVDMSNYDDYYVNVIQ